MERDLLHKAKKNQVFISIRFKIMFSSCVLIVILLTLIGVFSYSIAGNIMQDKQTENNMNKLKVIRDAIENSLIEAEKTSFILLSDKSINEQLNEYYDLPSTNMIMDYQVNKRVTSLMESIMEYQKEISSVIIYTPRIKFIWNNGDKIIAYQIDNQDMNYETVLTYSDGFYCSRAGSPDGKEEYIVQYIKKYEPEGLGFPCYIAATVSHKELLEDITIDGFFITNKDNEIIWTDDRKEIGNTLPDHVKRGSNLELQFDKIGWNLLYLMDKKQLTGIIRPIKNIVILYVCLSFVFTIVVSWFLSNKIAGKFKYVSEEITNFSGRNNSIRLIEEENKTYKNLFSRLSFYRKLLLYYMVLMIIPSIILIAILSKASASIILSNVTQSFVSTSEMVGENISLYLQNENKLSKYLLYNDTIQTIFKKYNNSSSGKHQVEDLEAFSDILHVWGAYNYSNYDITLYDRVGGFILSSLIYKEKIPLTGLVDPGFIDEYDKPASKVSFLKVGKTDFNNYLIPVCRRIKDTNNPFGKETQLGFIVLNIAENDLRTRYENINFGREGGVYLLDQDHLITSSLDRASIGKYYSPAIGNTPGKSIQMIDSRKYLVIHVPITDYGTLVTEISYKEILSQSNRIIFYNMYILIVEIIIAALLSFLISGNISRPLTMLKNATRKVAEGDFQVKVEAETNDELDILISSFNVMVKRIHDLIEQVYEARIKENELTLKQKEAELYALQAQINPHFLYNTLASVSAAIKLKETNDAIELINALAKLFRINISREEILVSITDEIEHVNAYLSIQKLKLESKFEYQVDVDPAVFDYKIIKLVLQPIVENAIFHGIEMKEGKSNILIKGEIKGECIAFTIEDDGKGMKKEELEALREKIYNDKSSKAVGLKNVYARLNTYFAGNFEYLIYSEEGKGTRVMITIPMTK